MSDRVWRPVMKYIPLTTRGNIWVVDSPLDLGKVQVCVRADGQTNMATLPDHIRLCEGQELPAPDWSQAPDWARWWAVEANGDAFFCQNEPTIEKVYVTQYSWHTRTGRVQIIPEIVDIPLGVDWRLLKVERPKEVSDGSTA